MRSFILLSIIVFLFTGCTGQKASTFASSDSFIASLQGNSMLSKEVILDKGLNDYQAGCAVCHGQNGEGIGNNPDLINCSSCDDAALFSEITTQTMPPQNTSLCDQACSEAITQYWFTRSARVGAENKDADDKDDDDKDDDKDDDADDKDDDADDKDDDADDKDDDADDKDDDADDKDDDADDKDDDADDKDDDDDEK